MLWKTYDGVILYIELPGYRTLRVCPGWYDNKMQDFWLWSLVEVGSRMTYRIVEGEYVYPSANDAMAAAESWLTFGDTPHEVLNDDWRDFVQTNQLSLR